MSVEQRQDNSTEFYHLMQLKFLAGQDREVDYDKIDNDESLDDLEMMDRDAQDRYFDAEEDDQNDAVDGQAHS